MNNQFNDTMERMVEMGIATEEEITLVCYINGSNMQALHDIIYVRTGYRSLDQMEEEE